MAFLKNSTPELLIAAAIALAAWLLIHFLYPSEPLNVAETGVVFAVFFILAKGTGWAIRRLGKPSDGELG